MDEAEDAAVRRQRIQHPAVAGQFEARAGQLAVQQILRLGRRVGEHGGRGVREDDGIAGDLEDLAEAGFADVHQVDHDPERVHPPDDLLAERGQAAAPVRRPAAVGEDVAAGVGQAPRAQAQAIVQVEEARIGAQSLATLESEDQRDLPLLLGAADVPDRRGQQQFVVAAYLVVQIPHHFHASPNRVAQPVVVEVDRAELGGDATLAPARQIVLAHGTEPDRVGTHAEADEGVVLQPRRRLPVETGHLDAVAEAHLALRDWNQDVAVTVYDDGAAVEVASRSGRAPLGRILAGHQAPPEPGSPPSTTGSSIRDPSAPPRYTVRVASPSAGTASNMPASAPAIATRMR